MRREIRNGLFSGFARYAVNGFMSFATAPLRGAVYLGFIVMIVALVYGIYIAAEHADFRWGEEWIFSIMFCNFIYRKHYYSASWNYWRISGSYLYGSEESADIYC